MALGEGENLPFYDAPLFRREDLLPQGKPLTPFFREGEFVHREKDPLPAYLFQIIQKFLNVAHGGLLVRPFRGDRPSGFSNGW